MGDTSIDLDLICLFLKRSVTSENIYKFLKDKLENKWNLDKYFNDFMDYVTSIYHVSIYGKDIINLLLDYHPITKTDVERYGAYIPMKYIVQNNIVLTNSEAHKYLYHFFKISVDLEEIGIDLEEIRQITLHTNFVFSYKIIVKSNLPAMYYTDVIKILNTKNIKPYKKDIHKLLNKSKTPYMRYDYDLCAYFETIGVEQDELCNNNKKL